MSLRVLTNHILGSYGSVAWVSWMQKYMNHLFPTKVPRHEVAPVSLAILKSLVGGIIKIAVKCFVPKHRLDNLVGVPIKSFIFFIHPLGNVCFRLGSIVLY